MSILSTTTIHNCTVEEHQQLQNCLAIEAAQRAQFTTVRKKSTSEQRPNAMKEKKTNNSIASNLTSNRPVDLADVFRRGRDWVSSPLFFIDHAVNHFDLLGTIFNSLRSRLSKSGICAPPYNIAILRCPTLIALCNVSIATLFLSPMRTDLSSVAAWQFLHKHRT